MSEIKIVHVYETRVWVESDMVGARHVVVQHETCKPFDYCTFHYGYGHTDNASTLNAATKMALSLGATEPIEHRNRAMKFPTPSEIQAQIEGLQRLLKD